MKKGCFKTKIDPRHSDRDYEDKYSSKRDVLPELLQRVSTKKDTKTLAFKKMKTLGRSQTKKGNFFGSVVLSQIEGIEADDSMLSEDNDYATFKFHNKTFVFCKTSLYMFDKKSRIRQFAVKVTESFWFDVLTNLVIVTNAILLGMLDYRNPDADISIHNFYEIAEIGFIVYNLIEVMLRVVARGLM